MLKGAGKISEEIRKSIELFLKNKNSPVHIAKQKAKIKKKIFNCEKCKNIKSQKIKELNLEIQKYNDLDLQIDGMGVSIGSTPESIELQNIRNNKKLLSCKIHEKDLYFLEELNNLK